jgi:hypothetical protein
MRRFLLALFFSLLGHSASLAQSGAPAGPKFPALDATVLDPALFTKKLEDVMAVYHREVPASEKALQERLREKMKERGVDLPEQDPSGFQWLSSQKDGLRAEPKVVDLFGQSVGEVLIRAGAPGMVGPMTVSLYNRGDDGEISAKVLQERVEAWKGRISTALDSKAEPRDQRGTVVLTGWMWRKGRTAWLLESSVSKGDEGQRAEFIRLRIASLDAPTGGGSQPARRSGLTDHVKKTPEGDVYLDGVPMVDQGQKGYCAVASAERVVRYYGLDVDQHEMAQIANTSQMGTSMEEMEGALKSATGKLHVRTTRQFDLDQRQFIADVKAYNQEAKKAGEKEFDNERNVSIVNPMYFWQEAKPEIFRDIKTKQAGFDRFTGKIEEYVDQGIPLCWALQLGMFKEDGIPQSRGGHMRLILGYNKKTKEILYSDSWGKGHEMKRMPAANAWCMTMALYTMAPTK